MVFRDAKWTDSPLAARCAAVASIGAAGIHCAVASMHWSDWRPSGIFFATIAVFQLVWGFAAWSCPTRLLLVGGVAVNFGSAALWVMSRTAGAPFGPNAGEVEAVEAAGISVLLLQCYVIMGATWVLLRRHRADEFSGFGRVLVLIGANTVMAGAVSVGLASGLQGHHHHHGAPAEIAEQVPVRDAHTDGHPQQPTDQGRPLTHMVLTTDDHQHDHGN